MIVKTIDKYAIKSWIQANKAFRESLFEKLQLFLDSFVFDSEVKEDLELLIEDYK